MTYAVIQTGGKQYLVREGETLRIEKLADEVEGALVFDQVLLVCDADGAVKIGAPYVEGAQVSAVVKAHGRADKVNIIKFRRRKHHMKRMGHRQHYTDVVVDKIVGA